MRDISAVDELLIVSLRDVHMLISEIMVLGLGGR